uniref:Uncharacterized protein n=1 Tax=Arundo donax TaxID=35708 RepID=A0A0A9CJ26_ARUDO
MAKLKQGPGMSDRDMDQPIADMPYDTEHSHMHVCYLGAKPICLRQTRDNLETSRIQ